MRGASLLDRWELPEGLREEILKSRLSRQVWDETRCQMKVAISSEDKNGLDGMVAQHFGRCPYYTIVEIEDNSVRDVKVIANPFYNRHVPGLVPGFIRDQGVDVMVAGGMGRRAIALFEQYGIHVVTGAAGTVRQAIEDLLAGRLSGAEPCIGGHGHPEEEV